MNKITATEAAYIAGIVDGEGTVSLTGPYWNTDSHKKRYRSFQTTFRVTNTDKRLIDWLSEVTGLGTIGITQPWSKSPSINNCKPVYTWYVPANGIRELLPCILPLLIIKKRQAEILACWFKDKTGLRGKNMTPEKLAGKVLLAKEMMALNHRGL